MFFLTLLYVSNYFTYTTISETVTLSIVLWVFSGYVSNKANRVAARHFEKVTQKVVSWSILPVPKEAGKHGSIFRGVTLLGHNKWYKAGRLEGRGIIMLLVQKVLTIPIPSYYIISKNWLNRFIGVEGPIYLNK